MYFLAHQKSEPTWLNLVCPQPVASLLGWARLTCFDSSKLVNDLSGSLTVRDPFYWTRTHLIKILTKIFSLSTIPLSQTRPTVTTVVHHHSSYSGHYHRPPPPFPLQSPPLSISSHHYLSPFPSGHHRRPLPPSHSGHHCQHEIF